MRLEVKNRPHGKKSAIKRLRREGYVPAVIYHKEKEGENVSVCATEFGAHLRSVVAGRLPTTIFTLSDEKSKSRKAIIKDIQYNPINYSVIHLDFEELHDNVPVKVKVPIMITGEADSVGVKLGGVVRLVIRHVKVECLPKDIPAFFEVSVKDMNLFDVIRLGDIKMPNTVRPLVDTKEVAVSMVKR
jgi:large subunit ribosomal protein L25